MSSLTRALLGECFGTALLLVAIVGSGIMGANLAAGNDAVTLLANSAATAAALVVLITLIAPLSGAHFNPLVTLMLGAKGLIPRSHVLGYLLAQFSGGIAGVLLVHAMFEQTLVQSGTKPRASLGLWLSELVATLILLSVVRACQGASPLRSAVLVSLTVFAGYWATSSTFFANPAVTLARAFTESFAGTRLTDVPAFLGAQLLALGVLLYACKTRR